MVCSISRSLRHSLSPRKSGSVDAEDRVGGKASHGGRHEHHEYDRRSSCLAHENFRRAEGGKDVTSLGGRRRASASSCPARKRWSAPSVPWVPGRGISRADRGDLARAAIPRGPAGDLHRGQELTMSEVVRRPDIEARKGPPSGEVPILSRYRPVCRRGDFRFLTALRRRQVLCLEHAVCLRDDRDGLPRDDRLHVLEKRDHQPSSAMNLSTSSSPRCASARPPRPTAGRSC